MVSFDFNFWTLSLLVLNFLLALSVAAGNRGKAKSDELNAVKSSLKEDIEELGHKVSLQGERLAAIEVEVENGINKTDLHAIYDRVNSVATVVDITHGRIGEMSNSIMRIDEHLMQILLK